MVTNFKIQPLVNRRVLRFISDGDWFFEPDNADYDYPANRDFSVEFIFRAWAEFAGTEWRGAIRKLGDGDVSGVTNTGWGVDIDLGDDGNLRVRIRYDTGGGVGQTETYESDLGDLNDGNYYHAIFTFDRTSGDWSWYIGYLGEIALDTSDNETTYIGNSFENDGNVFFGRRSPAGYFLGDMALLRLYNGVALSASNIANLANNPFDRIDVHGDTDLVYTDDPGTTPGCVLELLRVPEDVGDEDQLTDSANGVVFSNTGAGILNFAYITDDLPIKSVDAADCMFLFDTDIGAGVKSTPLALRDGNANQSFNKLENRQMNLEFTWKDNTSHADLIAQRDLMIKELLEEHNSIIDIRRDNAPYGRLLFDGVKGITDDYEEHQTPMGSFGRTKTVLDCSDPRWIDGYSVTEEITLESPDYEEIIEVVNNGNVVTYPRITLLSAGDPNGYVTIENLRGDGRGGSMILAVGEINQVDIWDPTDDEGRAIVVDCERGTMYWLDGYESKLDHFSGQWLTLFKGVNPLKFNVETVGGNRADVIVIVEFFELRV